MLRLRQYDIEVALYEATYKALICKDRAMLQGVAIAAQHLANKLHLEGAARQGFYKNSGILRYTKVDEVI